MPENVKNKPYLLTVLLKLDFFPHTTERAFFSFYHSPQTAQNSGINHTISGFHFWFQEKIVTGAEIDM